MSGSTGGGADSVAGLLAVVVGEGVCGGSSGRGGRVAGSSCGRQTEGNSPSSPGIKTTTQTQLNPVYDLHELRVFNYNIPLLTGYFRTRAKVREDKGNVGPRGWLGKR